MAGRARRYAAAVFELAREEDDLDGWADRVQAVRSVLTSPQVAGLLANPSISGDRRRELVDAIGEQAFGGREGLNLARLLAGARQTALIDDIADSFSAMVDQQQGRVRAIATTAIELSAADAERLQKDLAARLGKEVRLEVRVDPGIVGGLVLQVGDRVTDASVAARLRQLRRALATAS